MRIALISILTFANVPAYAQIGVDNTDPDPSAVLDLNATDKGLLIPRMSSSQREAIVSPANSLLVFDTDLNTYFYNRNGQWLSFDRWIAAASGSGIYYNSGNVGIGNASPHAPLQLASGFGVPRKIVLQEEEDNNHRVTSLGIGNNGEFVFQTPTTGRDYVFSAGTSSTASTELMRLTGAGYLGIGTIPHAPLQFPSTLAKRKVVLYESANNDHEFFGFGVDASGNLNYQTNGNDHVFSAATSSTTSNEVVRIKANGTVGIGNSNPGSVLDVAYRDAGTNILRVSDNTGLERWRFDQLFNLILKSSAGVDNRFVVRGDNGHLGIGTSGYPNAPLQFGNATSNRKIVLWETANNDHQFYGFGMTGEGVRYQTESNHVFYAGASSTTSNELMRITGGGNVGIGVTPSYPLDISATAGVLRLTTTGTGDVLFNLRRTGGTAAQWSIYIPPASTDIRFFNTSDRFIFTGTGVGTATDWVATSDRRLKEHLRPVGSQLDFITNVSRLVTNYDRKDNGENETGFVAQDLHKVASEYVVVPGDTSAMWSVNYGKMVVPLYKGTAELSDEVRRLREELHEEVERSLKSAAEIEILKRQIEELKKLLK